MKRDWNSVWEKVLSALLTLNIAVMGWLWANVARLADRLDRHIADRAIHTELAAADFVGRREFDAWRASDTDAAKRVTEELTKLETRLDRVKEERRP